MWNLTEAQATILGALLVVAAGAVGWFARGLAFLLVRWWTKAPVRESAEHFNRIADLSAKLKEQGVSLHDLRAFERSLSDPSIQHSPTAGALIDQWGEDDEPEQFTTTVAMVTRMQAALDVADAQLAQVLADLEIVVKSSKGDAGKDALKAIQSAWREYRACQIRLAAMRFEGGTLSGPVSLLQAIGDTEARIQEAKRTLEDWLHH